MRYSSLLPNIFTRVLMIAMLTVTFVFVANAAFGDRDQSFGTNGSVVEGEMIYTPTALALDGTKILIAGYMPSSLHSIMVLRRFNAEGSVDTTFGDNGTALPYDETGVARDVLVQRNGKIVVIGSSVWRFNPNGSYDPSFGSHGRISRSGFAGSLYYQTRSAVPKLIVVSYLDGTDTLYRLNNNGTPDASFGVDGTVNVPLNTIYSSVHSFAVRNGRIYVAGGARVDEFTRLGGAVAKYTLDGQPDLAYGDQGIAVHSEQENETLFGCGGTSSPDSVFTSISVQSDGRAIVTGTHPGTDDPAYIVGLGPSGDLSASFLMDVCGGPFISISQAWTVVQSDDSLLAAWYLPSSGLRLRRYTPAAGADVDAHLLQTAVGGAGDIVEQPDGKILVLGTNLGYQNLVQLTRHLPQ